MSLSKAFKLLAKVEQLYTQVEDILIEEGFEKFKPGHATGRALQGVRKLRRNNETYGLSLSRGFKRNQYVVLRNELIKELYQHDPAANSQATLGIRFNLSSTRIGQILAKAKS